MNNKHINPHISIRDISCLYAEKSILSHITLAIDTGDICIIRGASGCGKSTLLRIVAGIDMPSTGAVYYQNISTRDHDFSRLYRENIGVCMTDSVFFEGCSARENILFPSVFGKYGFSHEFFGLCIEKLDMQTYIDMPVSLLSSGERERVAFVRMIISEPKILILDEPFSHLDERLYTIALAFLSEYIAKNNATVCAVTHNKEFSIPHAKVFVLENGSILSL